MVVPTLAIKKKNSVPTDPAREMRDHALFRTSDIDGCNMKAAGI